MTVPHKSPFEECSRSVARAVKGLTTPMELYGYPCFREFVEQRERPTGDLIAIFAAKDLGTDVKLIASYALRNIEPGRLVAVGHALLDLLDRGEVEASVVEKALLPGLQWSQTLAEHYDDSELRSLLTRVLNTPAFPERGRNYIRGQVLTGEAKKTVAEMREWGEI